MILTVLWVYAGLIVLAMLAAAWNSMGYSDIKPVLYQARPHPFVSIIIPARNEIQNIRTCLESLVNQDYPDYEIIVVDGDSTDGTREFLIDFATRYARLRWVPEEPLPEKWVGKSFACWQGARLAKGEWLFFIDADTVHHRCMITSVIDHIQSTQVDFLSLMTGQKMESFWENVILPNVFLWFGTRFPIRRVNDPASKVARATGQFIAIRKDVYAATSGHAAIKHKVVEDFAFATLVKQAGYRIRIMGGRAIVSTRMYRNFVQIWEGFTKNIFFAAGESVWTTILAIMYILLTQVLPFFVPLLLFFIDSVRVSGIILAFFPLVMVLVVRSQLDALLGLSNKYLVSIPLGGLITAMLHLNSAVRYFSGRGMAWKGRLYGPRSQKI